MAVEINWKPLHMPHYRRKHYPHRCLILRAKVRNWREIICRVAMSWIVCSWYLWLCTRTPGGANHRPFHLPCDCKVTAVQHTPFLPVEITTNYSGVRCETCQGCAQGKVRLWLGDINKWISFKDGLKHDSVKLGRIKPPSKAITSLQFGEFIIVNEYSFPFVLGR